MNFFSNSNQEEQGIGDYLKLSFAQVKNSTQNKKSFHFTKKKKNARVH